LYSRQHWMQSKRRLRAFWRWPCKGWNICRGWRIKKWKQYSAFSWCVICDLLKMYGEYNIQFTGILFSTGSCASLVATPAIGEHVVGRPRWKAPVYRVGCTVEVGFVGWQ
jgi:hypothetical protein